MAHTHRYKHISTIPVVALETSPKTNTVSTRAGIRYVGNIIWLSCCVPIYLTLRVYNSFHTVVMVPWALQNLLKCLICWRSGSRNRCNSAGLWTRWAWLTMSLLAIKGPCCKRNRKIRWCDVFFSLKESLLWQRVAFWWLESSETSKQQDCYDHCDYLVRIQATNEPVYVGLLYIPWNFNLPW